MVTELVLGSLVLTSVFSATGAFFLFLDREKVERTLSYLISLSIGTIFGGVFIHLVFRLAESGYTRFTGLLILAGILGSYLLERAVHWHCHHSDHEVEPFSYVLIAGDSIHNVLDGVLIASSFLASVSTGIAATFAVLMHKVPKELGDFGILVHSGFSRVKALGFNLAISVFMLVGAALVIAVSSRVDNAVSLLLPLVTGNFVYIAGSDLLPEMKEMDEQWWKHVLIFCLGVGLMYLVPYLKSLVAG